MNLVERDVNVAVEVADGLEEAFEGVVDQDRGMLLFHLLGYQFQLIFSLI